MDDEDDIMALLAQEMATRQAIASIVGTAYSTDSVGVSVMAELGHRAGDHSISEDVWLLAMSLIAVATFTSVMLSLSLV